MRLDAQLYENKPDRNVKIELNKEYNIFVCVFIILILFLSVFLNL